MYPLLPLNQFLLEARKIILGFDEDILKRSVVLNDLMQWVQTFFVRRTQTVLSDHLKNLCEAARNVTIVFELI